MSKFKVEAVIERIRICGPMDVISYRAIDPDGIELDDANLIVESLYANLIEHKIKTAQVEINTVGNKWITPISIITSEDLENKTDKNIDNE